MSKAQREKGARFERSVVQVFQDVGIAAERVPLSGAVGGKFKSDVNVPIMGHDRLLECKKRAKGGGFKSLYDWLDGNYGLVVGADRQEPLVVVRLSTFAGLVRGAADMALVSFKEAAE